MKYSLIALLVVFGLNVAGQDDPLAAGMKAAKASMDTLSKAEKKTGPQITAAGERLGSIYENMIEYWRQRYTAPDAVKFSEQGKAAATMLASASFAGDEAKVGEAMKILGGTCKSCHDAHREKTPEGKYKIK